MVLEKATTAKRGKLRKEDIDLIDQRLREGATVEELLRLLKVPQSTFYFRLKSSGKRIATETFRFLTDAEG